MGQEEILPYCIFLAILNKQRAQQKNPGLWLWPIGATQSEACPGFILAGAEKNLGFAELRPKDAKKNSAPPADFYLQIMHFFGAIWDKFSLNFFANKALKLNKKNDAETASNNGAICKISIKKSIIFNA